MSRRAHKKKSLRTGICPICKKFFHNLTEHHKRRKSVWGTINNNDTIFICRHCHDLLEKEITRKENEILRQHLEIYIGTLNEFLETKNKG